MFRIVFAVGNGITRAPMATALFMERYDGDDAEVLCRGVVVAFPEPLNQKTEAILAGNDIKWEDFASEQLAEDDYSDDTYVFTMEERERHRIIESIEPANESNTFVLSEYIGDELEIMDPYGGSLQTYGLCFEVIKASVDKLINRLRDEGLIEGRVKESAKETKK